MPAKPSGERTEKATPRKRRKARQEGQIGTTPEIGAWVGLLAASFVVPHVVRSVMDTASNSLIQVGATIQNPQTDQAIGIARTAVVGGAEAVAPLVLLMLGVGVGSTVLQGGLHVSPRLLLPKATRLNPFQGIKRMFGGHGAWAVAKSLSKVAALSVVVYLSVHSLVPELLAPGSSSVQALLAKASGAALQLVRWCALAGIAMAFGDYAVVYRRNNKSLKMTKQELKEELRNSDGDPRLRATRRSRALMISRNRMMADVPDADVVVVNPTHVAVALRYEPGRGAPRVLAKGADHVAARIREVAQQHRIPMVEDVPLARTLYQAVDIGREIPADLFEAVARILAFVMTLKSRGSAAGTHRVRVLARR